MLDRRQFNVLCGALSLSLPALRTVIPAPTDVALAAPGTAVGGGGQTVKFGDGTIVPALGQGSWHLAQGRHTQAVEEEALRTGLSLGMMLIDTSDNYGGGRAEELIGRVIAGQRDRVFLVSKVSDHFTVDGIRRACDGSLSRLGTEYLDLYLLHWRTPATDLSAVVAAFEDLRAARKIRAWGVSNFKVSDMEDLFRVSDGHRCATNQVRYNLDSRGIESDLLPWCEQRGMPVMAYSPLGDGSLVRDPTLAWIGAAHDCSATAVALAWAIRSGNIIAIPEAGSAAHVKEDAAALSLTLTSQDLQMLDAAHPFRLSDVLRSLLDRSKRWLRGFLRTQ